MQDLSKETGCTVGPLGRRGPFAPAAQSAIPGRIPSFSGLSPDVNDHVEGILTLKRRRA